LVEIYSKKCKNSSEHNAKNFASKFLLPRNCQKIESIYSVMTSMTMFTQNQQPPKQ